MKTDELPKKKKQRKSTSFRSKTEEGDISILICLLPPGNSTLAPPINVPQFKVFHNVAFNFSDKLLPFNKFLSIVFKPTALQ